MSKSISISPQESEVDMAKDKDKDQAVVATLEQPQIQLTDDQLMAEVQRRKLAKLPAVDPNAIQPLKFRLNVSQHSGYDKNGIHRLWRETEIVECYRVKIEPEVRDEKGNITKKEKAIPYQAFDLAKRFNQPGSLKFTLVPSDTPSSKGLLLVDGNPTFEAGEQEAFENQVISKPKEKRLDGTDDVYDSMTMSDLLTHAAENEIDITGDESREALLRIIRQWDNLSDPRNQ